MGLFGKDPVNTGAATYSLSDALGQKELQREREENGLCGPVRIHIHLKLSNRALESSLANMNSPHIKGSEDAVGQNLLLLPGNVQSLMGEERRDARAAEAAREARAGFTDPVTRFETKIRWRLGAGERDRKLPEQSDGRRWMAALVVRLVYLRDSIPYGFTSSQMVGPLPLHLKESFQELQQTAALQNRASHGKSHKGLRSRCRKEKAIAFVPLTQRPASEKHEAPDAKNDCVLEICTKHLPRFITQRKKTGRGL